MLGREYTMNTRDSKLALVAMAALGLYVIACRPAFSPDGSKVAFPAIDKDSEERRVLVLDRASGAMATALSLPKAESSEPMVPSTAWTADGRQLVCLWATKGGELNVYVIPVDAPDKKRAYSVTGEDLTGNVMMAPAIAGDELFLGDEQAGVTIVNLKTGKKTRPDLKMASHPDAALKEVYFTGAGTNLFYVASGVEGVLEVGRLERDPWRTVLVQEIKPASGEARIVAVSPAGDRIAYVDGSENDQMLKILKGGTVEKEIAYGPARGLPMLGVMMWAPDGRTLYGAGVTQTTNDTHEAYLCEIRLDGWAHRETLVFATAEKDEATFALYMLAISPDGKTAALPDTLREKGEHALCLIDLAGKDRPVKRIPVPATPKPAPKAAPDPAAKP
jgi:hypothetical protein